MFVEYLLEPIICDNSFWSSPDCTGLDSGFERAEHFHSIHPGKIFVQELSWSLIPFDAGSMDLLKFKMSPEIPKSKMVGALMLTILLEFGKLGGAAGAPADSNTPFAASWKTEDELKFEQDFGISEDDSSFIRNVITGIIAFVIAVVAICLILCFCCPICILAKMRQRRGVVIRTPAANGQGITINVNRTAPASTSSPQVVAIPNNFNTSSKPYPVQESVTVVPLLQPQQPMQYPMPMHPQPPPPTNMNYPTGPQFPPRNFELPPPYPGLPRESDTSNLPYNPYFTGDDVTPGAPPPK